MPTNPYEAPKEASECDQIAALEVPEAILDLIPASIAREHGVLPIAHLDGTLYCLIAVNSFKNEAQMADLLSSCFDGQLCYAPVPQAVLSAVIERHYSRLDSVVFEITSPHRWVLKNEYRAALGLPPENQPDSFDQ